MVKAVFNWSGGKDSALALTRALECGEYEIVALLTTVNRESGLSSMHNIPQKVLMRQAESICIPLYTVGLTPKGDMADYAEAMREAVLHFKEQGVSHFIFGDIYLHDVRQYRERQMSPYGITVVEPLWGLSSHEVMEQFLASGIECRIVTTDASVLGCEYIGRKIDRQLTDSLPSGGDVCGENGEYHTVCLNAPCFSRRISIQISKPFSRTYSIRHDDGSTHDYTYWFSSLD